MCIDPAETELYRKYETFILDDKERLSLVIPPKYVTAYQCLSDTSIYFYKQNTFYKGEKYQYTITLQAVDVIWPLPPILSYRDAHDGHFPLWYINIESEPRKLLAPEEVNK
jgi:dTDP-4-dehydrorhamnose 3,5-epimerase-like enzyme